MQYKARFGFAYYTATVNTKNPLKIQIDINKSEVSIKYQTLIQKTCFFL